MNSQGLPTEQVGQNGEGQTEPQIFISENEWLQTQTELAELRGYRKGIEEGQIRLGQPHQELSDQPVESKKPPEFHLHSEEELQRVLDEGDLKSYHQMTTHNQEQLRKKDRWEIENYAIEPLRQVGSNTLSDLSGRFASQTMEHLDIPDVKKTYEERLKALKSQGTVVTPEVHQGVYEWAVGTNIRKVQEKIQQGFLRAQEQEVNTPSSATGRNAAANIVVAPPVEEFFAKDALDKLERKYPGLSASQAADREFSRHGGWESYYKKFYGPKEGEKK